MTPEMIPADAVLAALDGGKLIKVVAHETGLRVGQVKYIARNRARAKRAELRLSIDETVLRQVEIRARKNGRMITREIEHLLRLALSEEENPRVDDC